MFGPWVERVEKTGAVISTIDIICISLTAQAGLSLTVCPHLELEGIVPRESS